MKKLFILISTSTLLLLLFSVNAHAQIDDPSDLTPISAPSAIFCTTNHFSLNASDKDANNNTFSSYLWYEVNSAGGADGITGETDKTLELTNVAPGYHTYRVKGLQSNVGGAGGPTCQSDDFDDFTVYVLPALTVTASTTSAITKYCENAVPSAGSAIVLSSAAAFSAAQGSAPQGLTNPSIGDFTLNYKWFKVKVSDATRTEITGATSNTYTVAETEVGTFYYESEVTYAVKNDCGPYTGTVQSGGSNVEIIVTPKPGKPTISLTIN